MMEIGEETPEQVAVSARADGGDNADGHCQQKCEPAASHQSLTISGQPFPAPCPNPKQNQNRDDDIPDS